MASLQGFDANQVPEQQEFSALPPGQYVAIATASEMKPTRSGDGQYLQFSFEVLDGPMKGRKLWSRMNLVNRNQTAVDIAQRELAAMCRAVGVPKPNDSSELHNKPLLLTVEIEMDERRRENNVIKKFEATPTGGFQAPAPQAAASAPFAPAAQAPAAAPAAPFAPAAAAPAPAAAPWAAPAAGGAAPWKR